MRSAYFLCCFLPRAFLSQPKVTSAFKLTLCDPVLPGSGTTPLPLNLKMVTPLSSRVLRILLNKVSYTLLIFPLVNPS